MRIFSIDTDTASDDAVAGQFAHLQCDPQRPDAVADVGQERRLRPGQRSLVLVGVPTAQADFDGVMQHMGHLVDVGQKLGSKEYLALGLEHVSVPALLAHLKWGRIIFL